MILYSVVTEHPDSEPVTLAEAKEHLEYTGTAKNAYINSLIKNGRRLSERYTGLSLYTQERSIKLDRFPCKSFIEVPYGPIQAVLTFTYLNDNGGTTTLAENTDFKLDDHSPIARVYPIDSNGEIDSWPTDVRDVPNAVTITYQSGYDDVSGEPTPAEAKQAILMYCAKYFEGRGDAQGKGFNDSLPWECMVLLDSIKVTWNANID